MRVVLAAARFQAVLLRRNPADLTALITVPLYTLALLSIIKHAGRDDLAPYAVLGSTVIALWSMAIRVAGSMIDSDRHAGRLELLIAAPTPLPAVILGRCATVTLVSLLSIAESVLVARVVFGIGVAVPHVGLLVATLAVAVVAMAGTCIVIAGVFVLARSARIFQNSLSYPFYLLSGAVVPVALLPGGSNRSARSSSCPGSPTWSATACAPHPFPTPRPGCWSCWPSVRSATPAAGGC